MTKIKALERVISLLQDLRDMRSELRSLQRRDKYAHLFAKQFRD